MSNTATELGVATDKPPLDADHTALVLIDMIKGDTDPKVGLGTVVPQPHLFERVASHVVPNSIRLLSFFRRTERPIVHVRVVSQPDDASDWPKTYRSYLLARNLLPSRPGREGYEWTPGLEPLDTEVVIGKRSISAFNSTAIETILRRMNVEDIVFAGVTTNYGVGHSAIDAADRGFGVTIAEDATAAYSKATHDAWLAMHASYYLRPLSSGQILSELGGSGEGGPE